MYFSIVFTDKLLLTVVKAGIIIVYRLHLSHITTYSI